MARFLFLDDERSRHAAFARAAHGQGHSVVHVSDPVQAIDILKRAGSAFDAVYLDRDLNHVLTGEDVAMAMTKIPEEQRTKRVVIHSQNDYGAKRMRQMLRRAGYHVVRERFAL